MVTAAVRQSVSRICPRCSVQVAGWLVHESDGFVHCVSCGAVFRDPGYQGPNFSELFAKYNQAIAKQRQESQKHESALVTAWKQGCTTQQLAELTGLSRTTIRRRLLEETLRK